MEIKSTADVEELQSLCKDLLKGADLLSGEPYYIVQPFFGVVRKYAKLILKYNLMEKGE